MNNIMMVKTYHNYYYYYYDYYYNFKEVYNNITKIQGLSVVIIY